MLTKQEVKQLTLEEKREYFKREVLPAYRDRQPGGKVYAQKLEESGLEEAEKYQQVAEDLRDWYANDCQVDADGNPI